MVSPSGTKINSSVSCFSSQEIIHRASIFLLTEPSAFWGCESHVRRTQKNQDARSRCKLLGNHACNPNTVEVEAEGSEVLDHCQLHTEFNVSLGYLQETQNTNYIKFQTVERE